MNETKNQLIQTGFTLDRLHQDGKINNEAYTILKDRNKEAINYSQCCTELPSKEEFAFELKTHQDKWSKSHSKIANETYALGFRHCFHYISDWIKQH